MPSRSLLAAFATLCLGSFAAPLASQATGKPTVLFVLEAGEHEIADLLDRTAIFLGRNYIYAKVEIGSLVASTVKLQQEMRLDAQGCEEVVSQLAFGLGLAMVPVDPERGLWEWVNRNGPRRGDLLHAALALSPEEVLAKRRLAFPVATTIPLRHSDGNAVANQLRPVLMAQPTGVSLVGGPDYLVVSGFAPEVATVIDLVTAIEAAENDDPVQAPPPVPAWAADIERRLRALEAARPVRSTPKAQAAR